MSQPVEYVVMDEHTLLCHRPGALLWDVLAGKILQGGRDPKNGATIPPINAVLRPATREDFAAFRVAAKGHLD